jgi:hypothetical protein
MQNIPLSATRLKRCVEVKAFALGASSTASLLLGEYVVELLRTTASLSFTGDPPVPPLPRSYSITS